MAKEFRRTGKTTHLFEEAIEALGELPDGEYVYITGPDTRWLKELEYEFKNSGLVDVKFFTIDEIQSGALNGRRGVLMIDDFQDFSSKQMNAVLQAREELDQRSSPKI